MRNLAATPVVTEGLTHTQTSLSLLGITIVSLILALFLRRRVPRLASSVSRQFSAVSGRMGSSRGARTGTGRGRAGTTALGASPGSGSGSLNPVALARAALGWIALILFAVAGVAASGTFIGQIVLWAARTADSFFKRVIGLFPGGSADAATIGVSLLGLLLLWWGLHLVADLIEGRAHHGSRDWLVFAGPMLFTLVPGYFGQWSATAYAAIGTHVGPIVAHLV